MARQAEPWRRGADGPWYAWVNRKQVRLADREATKAEAWEVLHRLVAGKAKEARRRPEALSVADVLGLWIAARLVAVQGDPGAFDAEERERRMVKTAIKTLGGLPADSLRPADVQQWLNNPKWNGSTRGFAANVMKRAFRWARKAGHLGADPIAELVPPRGVKREAILTAEEYARLIGAIEEPSLRDIVQALRETGARPRELRTLRVQAVDLAGSRCAVVNKGRGKGSPLRWVYLSDGAAEIIRRRIGGRKEGLVFETELGHEWSVFHLARCFAKARSAAGLGKHCVPYALRHLYITDALEKGVAPLTVAELVGHKDVTMIMRVYGHLAERTNHLREAARAIRAD